MFLLFLRLELSDTKTFHILQLILRYSAIDVKLFFLMLSTCRAAGVKNENGKTGGIINAKAQSGEDEITGG